MPVLGHSRVRKPAAIDQFLNLTSCKRRCGRDGRPPVFGECPLSGKVRNELNAFNRKPLFDLLEPLRRKDCPFSNLPNSRRDHFGESVTAEEMEDYVWVTPRVVVQVRFAEWTRGQVLRHAEFAGVREDKTAGEVAREPAETALRH